MTVIFDTESLAQSLGAAAGRPLSICIIGADFQPPELSEAESKALAAYSNDGRRQSWLRARCALKTLMASLSGQTDTALVPFPDKRYSISHADNIAIAVARLDDNPQGMGVDLEKCRSLKPGAERFFLNAQEIKWLDTCPAAQRDDERIRLWTVKEAVYKSDCIAQDGVFKNYATESPGSLCGAVELKTAPDSSRRFRYATAGLPGGLWLSVSVLEE